ncbi:hypothetical protein [Sphingobacterium siyangense]|uniref:hypothetical protein n=1 Tax=Sphingobacterium siyangense TaxID=459529 RepID=UPI001963CE27|nr:hypothetical protein [Sphingobacterium siyangense]QRY55537.1 hypothetical protein JVX97_15970 [Sphingobacterium siyangense]
MQRLESEKHQNMIKAICRFEELEELAGSVVYESRKDIIKANIIEFKGSYDNYCLLLREIQECIDRYKEIHESLQRSLFPSVRRMAAAAKKTKERCSDINGLGEEPINH